MPVQFWVQIHQKEKEHKIKTNTENEYATDERLNKNKERNRKNKRENERNKYRKKSVLLSCRHRVYSEEERALAKGRHTDVPVVLSPTPVGF